MNWRSALIIVITAVFVAATIRGSWGNPTPQQIEHELSASGKPFETSQERSRWAILLSLTREKSVAIDTYASMGTPDIGRIRGHYYSFFPPTMSVFTMPAYLIGERVGASQVFAFLVPMIFTLGTMLLMYRFARNLNLSWNASVFAALGYAFATSAWGYSVTLFAHTASGFFLMLGLYAHLFAGKKKLAGSFIVWVSYALAVYTDYPNVFIFFPIALAESLRALRLTDSRNRISIKLDLLYLLTPLVFVAALAGYGYYNQLNFGNPLTMSNTIPRVKDLKDVGLSVPEKAKNSGQSLNTRNIVNGMYTFLLSPDRSIAIYTPAVLLFLFGLGYLAKNRRHAELLLVSVPATCFTLYIMFGDPYGGWAFGSRYMVAIMPELMILSAIGLYRFRANVAMRLLYTAVVWYSSAVVLMAPLTTNVIPPKVEADVYGLEYTYRINWNMLRQNNLNSLVYNQLFAGRLSGMAYYASLSLLLWAVFAYVIWSKHYD